MMSPSSRGRGLKYFDDFRAHLRLHVALFTRAWIEIRHFKRCCLHSRVALFTRAWIEIKNEINNYIYCFVALFTRAWIEIRQVQKQDETGLMSPSSRGRGLKY